MVAPAEVTIRVVEAPYSLLEKSSLPFSVCVELQENKVDISLAAWTVRKSRRGISLQLFGPLTWMALAAAVLSDPQGGLVPVALGML